MNKAEQRLQELSYNIKLSNTCVIGIPEEEHETREEGTSIKIKNMQVSYNQTENQDKQKI